MVELSEEKIDALLRCNKCGFCLAHCPIYKITGLESNAARGRIASIRGALIDGQLETSDLKAPVFNCLTCNACADDCPAGVSIADIILDTREELLKRRGQPWAYRFIFQKLLGNPARLHSAIALLRMADVLGLRMAAHKTGLLNALGDAGRTSVMMPRPPANGGIKAIAGTTKKIENPKYQVAYFVGCFAANVVPNEAAATVRVLNRHQVNVAVPHFVCCGIPALTCGDMDSAKILARKNIDMVANLVDIDAIVTPCASCSSSLKGYVRLLAEDVAYAEKAKAFSGKVKDFTEFLIGIGLNQEMGTLKAKVTYHDPCHLSRYQKIKVPPRAVLRSIPGVEFIEASEADMCCGAAGSYGFKNYELSMKVLGRKISNVEKTGAEILVTTCPACHMQLASGAKSHGLPIETLSIVDLLDRAYRKR